MKRAVIWLLCLICLLPMIGCGKEEPEPVAEELPIKTADMLLYHNGSTTLRFTYNEGKWIWVDGPALPLDDTTIQEILAALPDLLALKPTHTEEELSVIGLEEPSRYLTVANGENVRTFYFGAKTTSGKWYMQVDGAEEIYLAPNDLMELLSKGIYDMTILPTLPTLTEDIVTFIGVSKSEEENTYFLQTDGVWKTNGKDGSETARKILNEFAEIQILRCVDYFPADGVSELCGLTEDATMATVRYTNSVGTESELVLKIGGEMESGEGFYVTIGESDAIYCLPGEQLTTLLSLL